MAAGMTKTALTRHMAEKLELTNKQSAAFLDLLAETISAFARHSSTRRKGFSSTASRSRFRAHAITRTTPA